MGGNGSSQPDPQPSQELEIPWRKLDWGQKELLKMRLEEFSVCHPDVKHIRIVVIGMIGVGSSSFINSVNSAFQGRITSGALVHTGAGSFTKRLTTHRIRSGDRDLPFELSDLRGLEPSSLAGIWTEDVIKTIHGHVKQGYKFNEEQPISYASKDYISDPLLSDQAFCLVYIVDAITLKFMDDHLTDKLRTIRHQISKNRIPQVVIMTKVDEACPLVREDLRKIYTSKNIKEMMEMCSEKIGVPISLIFPVKNYCDEVDTNDDADVLILKAFEQIVNLANDRLGEALSMI